VGVVSLADWEEFVLPPTAAIVKAVRATGVPVIYFPNGATTLLEHVAAVNADVYGIDWRLPLGEARARLAQGGGSAAAVQGNLDPALLLGPADRIARQAAEVIEQGGGRGHVFNLGHGIYPETPLESVEALVKAVQG
jgi:uroporphyrinogen decarboxylase